MVWEVEMGGGGGRVEEYSFEPAYDNVHAVFVKALLFSLQSLYYTFLFVLC